VGDSVKIKSIRFNLEKEIRFKLIPWK